MALPNTFRRLQCNTLTTNFRKAVQAVAIPMLTPAPHEVVVKNKFAGVNATDINVTAGRYGVKSIPFPVGLEAVGEVVLTGANVKNLKIGDSVAFMGNGAFGEYSSVSAAEIFPVPEVKPEYASLMVTGLTASIGLDKVGEIKKGDKVLITAAAGALGQVAVQWCKAAGCHVIGMCSNSEKANILKDLGCDFVINYKEQNLNDVLKENYKGGLDVIWETIGGEVYTTLANHLAIKGRMVIIGSISGYANESGVEAPQVKDLTMKLLMNSSSIRGFIVYHYIQHYPEYFAKLVTKVVNGSLKIRVEDGSSTGEPFKGLEGCIKGVEYLHTGKSIGKIVVTIQ